MNLDAIADKVVNQATTTEELTTIWEAHQIFGPNKISWLLTGFLKHPNLSAEILTEVWYTIHNVNKTSKDVIDNVYANTSFYMIALHRHPNLPLKFLITDMVSFSPTSIWEPATKVKVLELLKTKYPELDENTPQSWLEELLPTVLIDTHSIPSWVKKKLEQSWGNPTHNPGPH